MTPYAWCIHGIADAALCVPAMKRAPLQRQIDRQGMKASNTKQSHCLRCKHAFAMALNQDTTQQGD